MSSAFAVVFTILEGIHFHFIPASCHHLNKVLKSVYAGTSKSDAASALLLTAPDARLAMLTLELQVLLNLYILFCE